MRLTHTISAERHRLTLHADEDTRREIQELLDDHPEWFSTDVEVEVCDALISNSELQWLDASDTGDLTDAPLLGIVDYKARSRKNAGPFGAVLTGGDSGGSWFSPILERWGYRSYALRSFVDDLLEHGEAVFEDSW